MAYLESPYFLGQIFFLESVASCKNRLVDFLGRAIVGAFLSNHIDQLISMILSTILEAFLLF